MLLIALGGQKLATRLRAQGARVRVASGLVIGLVALAIAFNLDTRFQTALPGYTEALQKHTEDIPTVQRELLKLRNGKKSIFDQTTTTTTTPVAQPGPGASSLPVLVASAPPIIAGGAVVQLEAAHAREPPRQGRPARLLDLLLHQLPAHASPPRGLVHRLPPLRARDHRRPQPRVRVRTRRLERRRGDQAPRHQLSRRPGQQLRDLEQLLERVLAGRLPDRPAGPDPRLRHRRGRLRRDGENIRQLLGVSNTAAPVPDLTPTGEHHARVLPRLHPARRLALRRVRRSRRTRSRTTPRSGTSRSTRSPTQATGGSRTTSPSPGRAPA